MKKYIYNQNISKKTFSLVELIVVVVIMMIIMGIMMPTFNKMLFGSGVNAATSMINGKLRACRAYALQQRKSIALIMPTTETTIKGENILPYRSVRPAIVTKVGAEWIFQEWVDGSTWTSLPTGAVITTVTLSNLMGAPITNANLDDTTNPFKVKLNATDFVRAITFKSNGKPSGLQKYIYIIEGYADINGGTATKVIRNPDNYLAIRVSQHTGRTEIKNDQ